MPFVTYLMILLSLIAILPAILLLIQVISAVLARNLLTVKYSANQDEDRPSVVVLVPAHNEENGITKTILSILPQLDKQDRLIVIADNCSDKTAEVARQQGASVIERFNQVQRGKGYALDFGVKHVQSDPPEIVMIIDADCEIAPGLVSTLANVCMKTQRPVQSNNIMRYPGSPSIKQQVAEFAWLVKNTVRPLGYRLMGLPCQLMGTGMAFLWRDIQTINLATGHLVEDMKLGLDLSRTKKPPVYCPETYIKSFFPTSGEGQASQRTRWEHGHISVILNEAPKYLKRALMDRNLPLLAQVFDLMVPPLALTFIIQLFLLFINLAFFYFYSVSFPLEISLVGLMILLGGMFIAWAFFGRSIISLQSLLLAPIILLMKIPLYIRYMIGKQVEWVRSKRDT